MPSPAALTVSGAEVQLSRQLIRDSRALIASAKELIRQSQWTIGQQSYLQIVCAWCQQAMHWQRTAGAARGQISHSICFDCFAAVFQELDAVSVLPSLSQKVYQC
jgi:hypothetical protein